MNCGTGFFKGAKIMTTETWLQQHVGCEIGERIIKAPGYNSRVRRCEAHKSTHVSIEDRKTKQESQHEIS